MVNSHHIFRLASDFLEAAMKPYTRFLLQLPFAFGGLVVMTIVLTYLSAVPDVQTHFFLASAGE